MQSLLLGTFVQHEHLQLKPRLHLTLFWRLSEVSLSVATNSDPTILYRKCRNCLPAIYLFPAKYWHYTFSERMSHSVVEAQFLRYWYKSIIIDTNIPLQGLNLNLPEDSPVSLILVPGKIVETILGIPEKHLKDYLAISHRQHRITRWMLNKLSVFLW